MVDFTRETLGAYRDGRYLMLTNPLDHAAVAAAFPEFSVDVDPLGCGGMKNAYKMERKGDVAVLKVVREPMPPADEEGCSEPSGTHKA